MRKKVTQKQVREFLKPLLRRKKTAHKGDFGRVLVVGGSEQYVGAIALASLAAKSVSILRTGVDLVTLASPNKVAWAINTVTPDLMTVKFEGSHFTLKHVHRVLELSESNNVVLLGPGLGLHQETKQFVTRVVEGLVKRQKLMVIDADALKVLCLQELEHSLLTPHARELELLLENSGFPYQQFSHTGKTLFSQAKFRQLLGTNVLLLKGSVDTIISRNELYYNTTGNPGMTIGGTGDVLAGICAGILCRTNNLFQSACSAAYLNGWIGDQLKAEFGYGFIASDFLPRIPKAIKTIAASNSRRAQ